MVTRWITLLMLLLVAPLGGVALAEQAMAPAAAAGQGLLWKIEKAGVKPSYLFGTMHSEDPKVVTLSDTVRAAFVASDRIVLEMVMDPPTISALSNTMQIATGPDLAALLGQPLYRQVVQAMSEQGIPEHVLRTMKPWAVATTMMVPKSNTGLFLDRVLYLEALAKGKPVTGLESVEEQVAVFDGMSQDDQMVLLQEALKAYPKLEQTYADMREAYVSRDLQALVKISDDSMAGVDPAFVKRFNARVITDRNQRMLDRLKTDLAQGGAFVAVGALHLAGNEGLIQQLRKQGYRVTAAY